jgi:hypothetical protein
VLLILIKIFYKKLSNNIFRFSLFRASVIIDIFRIIKLNLLFYYYLHNFGTLRSINIHKFANPHYPRYYVQLDSKIHNITELDFQLRRQFTNKNIIIWAVIIILHKITLEHSQRFLQKSQLL